MTLVLMLRTSGAIIFGLAADKWGRKWPYIVNMALLLVFELCTGFCNTFQQFLGVRALFGVAMGGMFGNCAATALEDVPTEAHGFVSGIVQVGYAFGYLLAVVFTRAIADTSPYGWRALFWFGAGPPVLFILFRWYLPETDTYLAQKDLERVSAARSFSYQAKHALKVYWLQFLYLVVFLAGMNYMSHGSQDLYPTFLSVQRGFSENASTVTNCLANIGALVGGLLFGHISEFLGRRLTIMICCVVGGALIYPWAFATTNPGITASVFFVQMAVQGAWGIAPIHISELSPPHFRAFIAGTAYQLGNLASSASSTIEARIGERFPIRDANGNIIEGKYEYGRVMAILVGTVFAFVFVVVLLGPENRDANLLTRDELELDEKTDVRELDA
jgi:SHS family lactate transporter-like MFS transporter